jgi:hypothetical protein
MVKDGALSIKTWHRRYSAFARSIFEASSGPFMSLIFLEYMLNK